MTTETCLQSLPQGQSAKGKRDFRTWADDVRDLEVWERRLDEYIKALEMVKHLAQR